MRAVYVLAVATLASSLAHADVAPPPREPGEGTWYGTMRQVERDREETYPVTLMLNRDGGTTDYPKLKCGGELARLGDASGGYVIYRETITRGVYDKATGSGCIDGIVLIHTDGDQMVLGWFAAFDGEPTLASARLTRSQFNSR